jgi:hypothetical protein
VPLGPGLGGDLSAADDVRLGEEDSQPPPTPGSVASGRMSRQGGVFFTALRRSVGEGGLEEEEDGAASQLSAR